MREAFQALASLMLAGIVCICLPGEGAADEPTAPARPGHNLFGMTGLIDMPTAEMQPDGQISITSSYFGGYLRNTLSAQILPGVEGAFRYSVIDGIVADGTLYDRSFDVKLRLVDEGPMWPGVVIGLQDVLGTGIYSGEYVATTKRFLGGDLKVTGGFGWGRFAGVGTVKNPFCIANDRSCDRDLDFGEGGAPQFDAYFRGEDLGFFGGLEWRTPIEDLVFLAEFSSDDYDREEATGDFERRIPMNFGAAYRPRPGIELGVYYMYGTELGLRLTLSGNPFRPLAPADNEPAPPPLLPRAMPDRTAVQATLGERRTVLGDRPATKTFAASAVSNVAVEVRPDGVHWATADLAMTADEAAAAGDVCPDEAALAIDARYGVVDAVTLRDPDGRVICTVALRAPGQHAVRAATRRSVAHPTDWYADADQRATIVERAVAALEPEKIGLFGIELAPERVTIYIENTRFRSMPRAIGRTARALSATMPPSVELFEIIPVEASLPVVSVMLERSALEDFVERPDAARSAWLSARVRDAPRPDWGETTGTLAQFPRPYWSISPALPINVFDPDQPFRIDLSVLAEGGVELLPGLSLNAGVQKRLIGNLDDIERESDSDLPRVRSEIAQYLRDGDPGIARLTADYVTKLDDALYGRLSLGLLEWMHGGVSGELLWKPATQSWGLGLEANWTRQRDFDMLFDFQDYDVFTGHASLYWDTGFHGLSTQIDAGRYLAGDWGGTFTLKRRFANGWEIGGFFTLTDVPFEEFGEGSFDKGIFLTIPFNWALPFESRSEYRTVLRPLTRDGGQRLQIANRLYPIVEDMDRGGLRRSWQNFWE